MHCVTGRMWVGLRIENALSTPLFNPVRPWGWSMKQEQRFLPLPRHTVPGRHIMKDGGWSLGGLTEIYCSHTQKTGLREFGQRLNGGGAGVQCRLRER